LIHHPPDGGYAGYGGSILRGSKKQAMHIPEAKSALWKVFEFVAVIPESDPIVPCDTFQQLTVDD
jgi:hypothetical protein